MTQDKAIEDFKELTYDLAKTISKLSFIKERVNYIVNEMKWDGLFEIDFSNALEKLANVQSSMVIYSFEDEYKDRDIKNAKDILDAYAINNK